MNIKAMRNVHLYLGVFFAPLLFFFLITGVLQTFNLHEENKEGSYKPPEIIESLAQVHKHQRFEHGDDHPAPSQPFRYLIVLMTFGLIATTVLGIIMAFKYTQAWVVWACLFGGVAIPCFLLWWVMR